ncbi:hypothetical protein [Paraburkholderia sp. SIMBA_027]|uniref:hypothetical protein n=2 Tax=Bacteria TaxID=2 RepID=UPI003978C2D8
MKREPLRFLRLLFVIASFSPLVIIWGVRGVPLLSEVSVWISVAVLVIVPNGVVWLRWYIVKQQKLTAQAEVQQATDHREHLVVYLLAVLLAMYGASVGSIRELIAVILAFVLVVMLFWFSNLHYLNVFFAILGYRTFTVVRRVSDGSGRKSSTIVLLTKRDCIEAGDLVICYRLSHDVFIDAED